jgi:chemotaxis protein histidine kinase CheA
MNQKANRQDERRSGENVAAPCSSDCYAELQSMTDRLCRLMQWEPGTAHKFEIVRQTCSGKAAALSIEKGNQIADKLEELMKAVCDQQLAAIGEEFLDGMAECRNDDPIYDIRVAVSEALRQMPPVPFSHKEFVDLVVDNLPDFFRQPLSA